MQEEKLTLTPLVLPTEEDLGELELGPGMTLGARPDWLTNDVLGSLGVHDRIEIADATYWVAVNHTDLDQSYPHVAGDDSADRARQLTHLFELSVWIARPCAVKSPFTFHVQKCGGTTAFAQRWLRHPAARAHPSYEPVLLSAADCERARDLCAVVVGLPRRGSVWMAMRMLAQARPMDTWETRFLFFWMMLEALFGPDGGGETTHQLAERVAKFLRCHTMPAPAHYARLKRSYALRSRIVHGRGISSDSLTREESLERLLYVEMCARDALMMILRSRELVDTFSGKARESYLLELVLGNK